MDLLEQQLASRIKRIQSKERPFDPIPVQSNSISLNLLSPIHAPLHYSTIMKNKEYLSEYLPWASAYSSLEDSEKFIAFIETCHEDLTKLTFVILDGSKVIGSIAFQTIDLGTREGEIGYWIDAEYQGKGIMTDCVEQLIPIGFNLLELDAIIIKCDERNTKSANIPIRAGFTEQPKTFDEQLQINVRTFTLLNPSTLDE